VREAGATIARVNAFPGLAAAAGGVVIVLGAFLAWVRFWFASIAPLNFLDRAFPGTSSGAGKAALVGGLLLLACSAVMVAAGPRARKIAAGMAVALGLCAAVLAASALATQRSRVVAAIRGDVERAVGHTLSPAQARGLTATLLSARLEVSAGAGVFVVLAGGSLAVAGGLTGLALRGGEPLTQTLGFAAREPAPPFPPAPEPGPLPSPEPGPLPSPGPDPVPAPEARQGSAPPVVDSGEV